MTKRTHASVTEEPCRCFYLHDQAQNPFSPIKFDSEMNEYRIEYGDPEGDGPPRSVGALNIYHCPFCGGAAPESRRAQWFATVPPEESDRLLKLFEGIKSIDEAIAAFGPPSNDLPNGETETRRLPDGNLGPTKRFRTLLYSNLSESAEVRFSEAADGAIQLSIGGKYLGRPAVE